MHIKLTPLQLPVPSPALLALGGATGAMKERKATCSAAHIRPAPLAGGAPLETPFGTFHPPNITTDPGHGIGEVSRMRSPRPVRRSLRILKKRRKGRCSPNFGICTRLGEVSPQARVLHLRDGVFGHAGPANCLVRSGFSPRDTRTFAVRTNPARTVELHVHRLARGTVHPASLPRYQGHGFGS